MSPAENGEDINLQTDTLCPRARTYRYGNHGQRVHVTFRRHLFLFDAQLVMFRSQVAGYLTADVANVEAGTSHSIDKNVRL